jgi:ClpP class serine protease
MRDIPRDDVINTQAGLVFGQEAVTIGLVDGIISFDDLLQTLIYSNLQSGPIEKKGITQMFLDKNKKKISSDQPETNEPETVVESPEAEATPEPVADEPEVGSDDPVERAAEIASVCAEAGMSDLAPSFIRSKMTLQEIRGKIDVNDQIRKACKLAGKPDRAEGFIQSGKTLKAIQDELISEMADSQEEISPSVESDAEKEAVAQATSKNAVLESAMRLKEKSTKTK